MTGRLQVYCTIVMGVGSLACAAPSFAQDNEEKPDRPVREGADRQRPQRDPGGAPRDRSRFQGGISPLMRVLDRNSDGKLDAAEIEGASASLLKLDRNGDGEITRDEIGTRQRPGQSRPDQPRPDQARLPDLSALDKDGDGKISKEEAPERMLERFDRMDRNGDGFIDKQEQEMILRFLRQRGQGDGPRRPDRTEGEGGSEKPKRPALDES